MHSAYLAVETHPARPGMVRLFLAPHQPEPESCGPDGRRLRYVARFNDGDAALMHAHDLLRRRLVDVDARLYRVSCEFAVAAIESLGLAHKRVYLDPDFGQPQRSDIARRTLRFRHRRQLKERVFTYVGYLGIALLLFNLLLSLG
jgi:hypothetical protein